VKVQSWKTVQTARKSGKTIKGVKVQSSKTVQTTTKSGKTIIKSGKLINRCNVQKTAAICLNISVWVSYHASRIQKPTAGQNWRMLFFTILKNE
jgi:hypothetical protein